MFRYTASAFLAAALFCGSASSAPITVYFSGQISSIISDDSSGTFGSNFAVGDTVNGSWTFDSAAAGTAVGSYSFYAASFIANIGASTFSGAAEYRIFDRPLPDGDGFSVINETSSYSGPALGPLTPRTFFLQFSRDANEHTGQHCSHRRSGRPGAPARSQLRTARVPLGQSGR